MKNHKKIKTFLGYHSWEFIIWSIPIVFNFVYPGNNVPLLIVLFSLGIVILIILSLRYRSEISDISAFPRSLDSQEAIAVRTRFNDFFGFNKGGFYLLIFGLLLFFLPKFFSPSVRLMKEKDVFRRLFNPTIDHNLQVSYKDKRSKIIFLFQNQNKIPEFDFPPLLLRHDSSSLNHHYQLINTIQH